MTELQIDYRRAFDRWIRTGHWPPVRRADGVELKFNPYHDPANGQFTSGPESAGTPVAGGLTCPANLPTRSHAAATPARWKTR